MSDPAIANFALLSDCQSAALVGRDGSIDWYCPYRFDAPSVFACLLDPQGGHWSIRPTQEAETERSYLDDTLVLRTIFRTARGTVAITDALALGDGERGHQIGLHVPHILMRRVEGLTGEVELEIQFAPRLEYALTRPRLRLTEHGVLAYGGPIDLHLLTKCPLELTTDAMATARFTVHTGEVVDFALVSQRVYQGKIDTPIHVDVGMELDNTCAGWRSWSDLHRSYDGPYVEQVRRSALVLQALTYRPTGGVVAAATTSLPEIVGGDANWDYRYVWLRDLSLTLRALWIAACPDEAEYFFRLIDRALGDTSDPDQSVQIMYSVEGERNLAEHTLDHLQGFQHHRPVRVGNGAWRQKQLDVLGEVVDAVYLFRDRISDWDGGIKRLVVALADQAAASWHEPDSGMWEARDQERHYLSSKVMCWVALDRVVKLAPKLGEQAKVAEWEAVRDEIRQAILERGWSESAGAYTGAFGSDHLDASVLLMPLVDFLPATDPGMRATVEAIERELAQNGLVHRWVGDQNGFFLCTYWLVECLARIGEIERATELFERTTAYANDLGLLSEMGDPCTGTLWGNYPQAFSHIGLINAAWCLGEAQRERGGQR
jgi:GH15 family glucan-1,4-alpha-glucosidase